MILGLVAISGMLAAEAAAPGRQPPTAIEITFSTHAGEGAEGRKRFDRDGCYQVESGGSTGGAGYARDSQAGCHLPADVAAVFAKLAAISGDALEREKPARASATGGAPRNGMAGLSETNVVMIRADGSRWVAANKATADEILRAVNELPSENQWYAKPPEKAVGAGPQLLVLSVAASGDRPRLQASLTAEGRWWCNRSVVGPRGGEPKLPAKKPTHISATEIRARLGRILAEAHAAEVQADPEDAAALERDRHHLETETSVEVASPGQARAPLRPFLHGFVARRFVTEMKAASPACTYAPERTR